MSLGNEFQVVLPSNVIGPKTNTPGAYETSLAHPLDLPGTWEVGLIDIAFPHTWLDLDKEVVVGISMAYMPEDDSDEKVNIIGDTNSMDLVRALRNIGSYYYYDNNIYADNVRGRRKYRGLKHKIDFKVKKTFGIIPNKYKLKDLLDKLQTEIRSIGVHAQNTRVFYDKDIDRVTISGNQRKLLISSYSKNSILPMLGFANQLITNKKEMEEREMCLLDTTGTIGCLPLELEELTYLESPEFTLIDYIIINRNGSLEASLPPKLGRLNEIFVYTDIVNTVLVGNSQVPMLGYFPIQSKWGDQAYWNFNPPYYMRVKDSNIRTIVIRLCDKTGETINFESGDVICRLNFRRVGLLNGFF